MRDTQRVDKLVEAVEHLLKVSELCLRWIEREELARAAAAPTGVPPEKLLED